MFLLTTLAILTVTGSMVDSFQVIEGDNLNGFLISFRQVLLEEVAIEVNLTVELTELLNEEMETCKPLLQIQADECKACAMDKCQQTPSFEDYLQLANPYLYLKDPLDNIGNKIEDAIDLVGEHAGGFYNSVKNLGESFASGDLFEDAFDQLNQHLHLDKVTDFFEDVYSEILNIDDFASDLFNDIFGKKRRKRSDIEKKLRMYRILAKIYPKLSQRETIDPELKQCMAQCSSCHPLLKPTQEEMVTAVCGDTIATLNASIHARVLKMQTVYNFTLDRDNAIVKMLELDPATYNFMTGEVSEVYITAYLASEGTIEDKSYKTEVAYLPLQVDVSARNMGLEYWNKFEI